ncbi:uncharacterized protein LOC106403597 [Brassica napus]|uniref:uncharacterized protein LOC106403597 n=1 Tax=Brassica napus TaxID=3708 RepID=UPI002079DCA7|nr:uncharacterized protein LOC106403597 [Brassica napus]
MDNFDTPEQIAASLQQMQQQTIAAQQLAAQQLAAQQLAAQHTAQHQPLAPIGERNLPHNIPATRSAIAPPPCQRADFEIKPGMINLVQRKMFHGLSAEIPMEHTEAFEEICSFTRANGVPPDFIKCMLFPFSLADKASRWLKSLPTGSLTTLEQPANKPFNEAWERFNDTLRECPHHGFDDDHVLGIFYDGVDWEFRNALNAASNGDFMTQTTEGAHALIENMAASSSNKNEETGRSKKVNSMDTRKIDDLAAKVDLEPGTADATEETKTSEENQQEVSYINGQGWQFKNYHPNPNVRNNPHMFSYKTNPDNPNQAQNHFQNKQNNPHAAPATASGPPDELKGMMQQLLQGQQIQRKALKQVTTEINTQMDNMFMELNSKYDVVASHIRQMDVQIVQTAETIKRQQGTLPGKKDKNPKECNAVDLRSGRHLPDHVSKKLTAQEKEKHKEGEQPPLEDVHDDEQELEQPTVIEPVALTTQDQPVPTRVYTPKVPYPVPAKKLRKNCEEMKCKKMLDELNVKLSLMDVIQMIPSTRSLVKELISGKTPVDSDIMMVSKECSAVFQNRTVRKLEDPGKFVLSVQIEKTIFACSLCDLSSSVNLMPYSNAKRMGLTNFKPIRISLVFADRSVKLPVGVLEDLQVQIGNTTVPADFVVLEVEDEPKDPLILGRHFLCTAGAIIDVRNGRIDLQLGDIVMKFEMDELLKRPMLDGQNFTIDDENAALTPQQGMIEEILADDSLEVALIRAESEQDT